MTSFTGSKMGPIKDISIGKEHAKGSKQALLVSQVEYSVKVCVAMSI